MKRKKLIIISLTLATCFYFTGCIRTSKSTSVKETSNVTYEETVISKEDDSEILESDETMDVGEYYKENSEIIASYDVNKSENIQSEKQAVDDISNRGFEQYPVYCEYSIEGEYIDEQEVSSDEEDKHPIYQTYYLSSNGELWTIITINGKVIANPVSYNMQSERDAQLIISETDVITGYDNYNNMFYETIPKESELIVHVVDKIDAETLDALTVEVISKL